MDDPHAKHQPTATPTPPPASEAAGAQSIERSTTMPPVAKVDPYVGKTFDGRYLIEAVLGEGGMGVVYRGKHKVIDKKVAIKVLRGELARDKEITERFLQEAKAASTIGNPHIIDISDFGQLPDGATYFVMEFLQGKSLTDVMREVRPLPVPRLLHIAKQLATGLSAAHEAGIVHRDLKPDNVMLINRSLAGQGPASRDTGRDFVKILDFGIAKVGGEASRLTRAGSVFGTPHYMSPEQAAGTSVDLRTDIYAFGVILYELASGKVPFDADNFMGILTQHMYKKPPWIRELVPTPDVPPGLDAIIQKCLTKKPEGRYASMGALVAELERLEQGLTPEALPEMMSRSGGFNVPADYFRPSAMPVPVPATPSGTPARSRRPLLIGVAVAGTIALAAIAAFVFGSPSGAARTSGMVSAAVSPAPQKAPDPVSAPAAPTTPPAVAAATQQVFIATDPEGAVIKRDGQTLGKSPLPVALKLGETASLVLSHAGFKDRAIDIDGSTPTLSLTLDPVKPAGGKPATNKAPSPPANKPPSGSLDGLGDPWGAKK